MEFLSDYRISIDGEGYQYAIPGSVQDVWEWLQQESTRWNGEYRVSTWGDNLMFTDDDTGAVAFYDFSRVTDSRSTFQIVYGAKYKRLAFLLLARLGAAFGAPWQVEVKAELATIPQDGYSEWVDLPGPFPGTTMRALVWRDGPPPAPAPQPEGVEQEPKADKLPELPKRKPERETWIRIWQLIRPKIENDFTLTPADLVEFVSNFEMSSARIKAVGRDTLNKILELGKAGGIPDE